MRALVCRETDLVLDNDYPLPAPVDGEALIRVLLTGICNTDLEIVRGYMAFQGVLGHEFVGVVEEIYGDVAQERYGRQSQRDPYPKKYCLKEELIISGPHCDR